MKHRHRIVLGSGIAAVIVALTTAGAAQGRRSGGPGTVDPGTVGGLVAQRVSVSDDPFSGPVVTKAPFSADATTTVTQVLSDGTRIEQTTTSRFYRDSAGRVRREQTILGLAALNPSGEQRVVITIVPDPGDANAYTLDPVARTARQVPRSGGPNLTLTLLVDNTLARGVGLGNESAYFVNAAPDGGRRLTRLGANEPAGVAQPEESLGTRQVEGVAAVGRRTKSTIPTGQIGNDRPIEITDERWESQELRLLIRSHHRDPRTGDVEYRLTNIIRAEPPADLFQVPSDYTILSGGRGGGRGGAPEAPAPRSGGGGRRSGGGGQ
jgi:hypothetical protein